MIAPTPEEEAEIEASKAPLLSHLVELRKRIIYSLLALAVGFVICFAFSKEIYAFLTEPMARAMAGHPNHRMIYTAVYETFFTYVKVGLFGGICLAFPVIAAQIWLFIGPGLYKHERKAFLPFLAASPALFIAGGAFVYYIMLPYALRFFLGFQTPGTADTPGIELQAKVSDYLDFVTALIAAFGITFQMPVLLTILGKVGIVSSGMLRRSRRYAIVGIAALAMLFTPPDIFSMVSLIVPLVFLYEVSIWLVWLIEKRRKDERDAEDDNGDDNPDGPDGADGSGGPVAPVGPDDATEGENLVGMDSRDALAPPESIPEDTLDMADLPGTPPEEEDFNDGLPVDGELPENWQMPVPDDGYPEDADADADYDESEVPQMPALEDMQEVPDDIPEDEDDVTGKSEEKAPESTIPAERPDEKSEKSDKPD